jgi:hypothetical protein
VIGCFAKVEQLLRANQGTPSVQPPAGTSRWRVYGGYQRFRQGEKINSCILKIVLVLFFN